MFETIKKYKHIVIGVAAIVVAGIAYTYFFKGSEEEPLLSSELSSAAALEVGADVLALLRDLQSIQLDESIWSDPAFRGLQDFGRPLIEEPVGRSNPFAPVGEE